MYVFVDTLTWLRLKQASHLFKIRIFIPLSIFRLDIKYQRDAIVTSSNNSLSTTTLHESKHAATFTASPVSLPLTQETLLRSRLLPCSRRDLWTAALFFLMRHTTLL
jgi:hypothetical protein